MTLQIGDTAPDFEAETSEGKLRFHDWIGDSWVVLFSHPRNFTPVCTTELGYMVKIKPEFDRRNTKIIGLSVDPVDNHPEWAGDIEQAQWQAPNYPLIGDRDLNVSKLYGMLPAATDGDPVKRTAADNQTVRNVFVIGPDKQIKLILVYPMTTGRNFDEVLRVLDSLQLTAEHRLSTPVNWRQGEDVITAGSVSEDEARSLQHRTRVPGAGERAMRVSALSRPRVLVLGAGFGGLELTSRLSEEFGDGVEIVLIDQSDVFVFGFSKLDVMFGRALPSGVRHAYRDMVKPGVRFVQATVRSIDPVAKRVETDAGPFECDVMVVALGADLDPAATPGLSEGGHEFYTVDGAFAARDVLAAFGGGRVIIGVLSTPFKCPPAPSETALLLHDHLVERGLRDRCEISLVIDFPRPIPPSPEASSALVDAFAERGIEWHPRREVCELDPSRRVAILRDGGEMAYDLFLGVPVHRAPAVVVESGMTVDGWIPVDSLTLETSFPGVFAVGDVAAVGTPRAGVFAEGHAAVAAERIAALIRGTTTPAQYGGRGICYLEFGRDQVALVDVTFFGDQRTGALAGPSETYAAEKVEFGSSRIKRWFGREWKATSHRPGQPSLGRASDAAPDGRPPTFAGHEPPGVEYLADADGLRTSAPATSLK